MAKIQKILLLLPLSFLFVSGEKKERQGKEEEKRKMLNILL